MDLVRNLRSAVMRRMVDPLRREQQRLRAEQLRKLDEERKRLDEEVNGFHEYMRNLRMARDREEFDRFMNDRRGSRQGFGDNRPEQNNGDQNNNGWSNNNG